MICKGKCQTFIFIREHLYSSKSVLQPQLITTNLHITVLHSTSDSVDCSRSLRGRLSYKVRLVHPD